MATPIWGPGVQTLTLASPAAWKRLHPLLTLFRHPGPATVAPRVPRALLALQGAAFAGPHWGPASTTHAGRFWRGGRCAGQRPAAHALPVLQAEQPAV